MDTTKEQNNFPINQRFEFLEDLATMVAKGEANSLIITGKGGLGKTYSTMKAVDKTAIPYKKFGGHVTARGLFNILYDYNNMLLIFDDCDNVLLDKTSQNLLKIALDSNGKRLITWGAKMSANEKYPQQFEFTGRIIFITNLEKSQLNQAVITRAYKVDLEMTNEEKLERMKYILPKVCQDNDISIETGSIAHGFLCEKKDEVNELNMRSLLDVIRILKSGKKDWYKLAEYTLME